MLAKSEIALLTVSVLGTLAAWLAGPHPLLVTLSYDEHSIARSAPATAFRGIRASLGEENASFAQVSPMFHAFPYLPRTESHRANVWPDEQNANLKTADITVTSRGNVSKEAAPNSGSVLWHKCSTL